MSEDWFNRKKQLCSVRHHMYHNSSSHMVREERVSLVRNRFFIQREGK